MPPELTCLLPDAQSPPTPTRCFVGTRGVVFLPPSQPQCLLSKPHTVQLPSAPAVQSLWSLRPRPLRPCPRLRAEPGSSAHGSGQQVLPPAALAALIPMTEVSGPSSPTPQPCPPGDAHGLRSLCDPSGGRLGVLGQVGLPLGLSFLIGEGALGASEDAARPRKVPASTRRGTAARAGVSCCYYHGSPHATVAREGPARGTTYSSVEHSVWGPNVTNTSFMSHYSV